jgi:hypothetical protein
MDRRVLDDLLSRIDGCTFATIDATTTLSAGLVKVVTGKRVILFTNKISSGYENMVKRRLEEAGKDPKSFHSGDLPWGTRIHNSPLIEHKGRVYLQTIDLTAGQADYFMLGDKLTPEEVEGLKLKPRHADNQGLALSSQVQVSCYLLENIDRIVLMGEQLVSEAPRRAVLKLNI